MNRTAGLEDSQNLVTWSRTQKSASINHACTVAFPMPGGQAQHTSDDLDLGNSVGVTQDDTDLGWGGTLLGQLADLVDDLVGGGLEPRGSAAAVGDGGSRNSLSVGVKTTHFD